jgi:WhiB family redox-sensing transcriptional regulator
VAAPGPELASRRASYRRPGAAGPHTARAGFLGWMSFGACRSEDPELFFPFTAAGHELQQVDLAKVVCARCLVRADCLSYALITGQDEGIWGATTWEERWPSRRPRRGLPSGPASQRDSAPQLIQPPSDTALADVLARVGQGAQAAFEKLYERTAAQLFSLAKLLIRRTRPARPRPAAPGTQHEKGTPHDGQAL